MTPPTDSRLAALETRRQANVGSQVDNSKLPAGSNMYYYCQACGAHTATRPELWYEDKDLPPKFCPTCNDLIHDGVISRTDNYDDWLEANSHPRTPS